MCIMFDYDACPTARPFKGTYGVDADLAARFHARCSRTTDYIPVSVRLGWLHEMFAQQTIRYTTRLQSAVN